MDFIISTLMQGLPYAFLALGVFISYRVLDFADLTTESSFVLGGAISLALIIIGVNPYVATLIAMVGGALSGVVTGLLHTKLKIPELLSGIITMSGLVTIFYLVMGIALPGKMTLKSFQSSVNITLGENKTFFSVVDQIITPRNNAVVLLLVVVLVIVVAVTYMFFGTEIGMSMRATGMNSKMARSQGINTTMMIIGGLALANALIALGGSLFAQANGTITKDHANGTIVIGLAAIIIGEAIFGKRSFLNWIISVALGTVVYFIIINSSQYTGLPNFYMKLIIAVIIVFILALPIIKKKTAKLKAKIDKNKSAKVGD